MVIYDAVNLAAGGESGGDDEATYFTYCARFVQLLAGVGCTHSYSSFHSSS